MFLYVLGKVVKFEESVAVDSMAGTGNVRGCGVATNRYQHVICRVDLVFDGNLANA